MKPRRDVTHPFEPCRFFNIGCKKINAITRAFFGSISYYDPYEKPPLFFSRTAFSKRFHPDRIARRRRHHRYPGRSALFIEPPTAAAQSSLKLRNRPEALAVLNAKNESVRQPVLNLQIPRAYLSAAIRRFLQRTRQVVM
jgi:hypothetical protein